MVSESVGFESPSCVASQLDVGSIGSPLPISEFPSIPIRADMTCSDRARSHCDSEFRVTASPPVDAPADCPEPFFTLASKP
jgi:hypothetical protein